MAEPEFPSNVAKAGPPPLPTGAPAPKEREKKVEALDVGEVMIRKPSLGKRFKATFFGGDAKETASFVWSEIVVNMAKNAFLDAIQQGSERMVNPSNRRRMGMSQGTLPMGMSALGHQAYNTMFQGPVPAFQQKQQLTHQARANHNYQEIILQSRPAAELVIDRLYDLLSRDGYASVADFYDLLGYKAEYTDLEFGWMNLQGSQVVRTPQGYHIDLPRPVPLPRNN